MHTIRRVTQLVLITVLAMSLSVCSSDQQELPVKEISISSTVDGSARFTIVSNNITETDAGYEFNGILKGTSDQGDEFVLVEGDISIEINETGGVIDISGEGFPSFPNVGNFGAIRRDFEWNEKVKSHVDFELGSFYKTKYDIDFPLNDTIKYIHFKVFDEENDQGFELRSILNDQVYQFVDFYVDPNDPAVFFKMDIFNPFKKLTKLGKYKITKNLTAKILGKASQETIDELAKIKAGGSFSIGFSNQGHLNSRSYEFSNPENFVELYGYSGFESRSAHLYERFEGIPIPGTFILKFTGEAFIHYPIKRLGQDGLIPPINDWGNWFDGLELDDYHETFTGSIDPGGKGIGMILGVLPQFNDLVGYDIFNKDLNIDVIGASLEISIGESDDESRFVDNTWRLGIEIKEPIIADILGEKYSKYVQVKPQTKNFFYLSLEEDFNEWSLYLQGDVKYKLSLLMPPIESGSYFLFDKDGIKLGGYFTEAFGPLDLTNEYTGSINLEGFELATLLDKNIELSGGLVLSNTHFETTISSTNGVHLEGTTDLPFGIAEAEAVASFDENGFEAEGSFTSGITLPNGVKVSSYGAGFTYTISSDPEEGVSISGFIDAPGNIGEVEVQGWIKNKELYLYGKFEGTINFNGVNLFTSSGEIEISSALGYKISGNFVLPDGLGTTNLSGFVNNSGFNLTGNLGSTITIGGHQFLFANSRIIASSTTGVQISGNIDLYAFNANVSGAINPNNTFLLTGSRTIHTASFESTIRVRVNQNEVALSGNGCLFPDLILEKCGEISFNPNWNAKTIQTCIGVLCVNL